MRFLYRVATKQPISLSINRANLIVTDATFNSALSCHTHTKKTINWGFDLEVLAFKELNYPQSSICFTMVCVTVVTFPGHLLTSAD